MKSFVLKTEMKKINLKIKLPIHYLPVSQIQAKYILEKKDKITKKEKGRRTEEIKKWW